MNVKFKTKHINNLKTVKIFAKIYLIFYIKSVLGQKMNLVRIINFRPLFYAFIAFLFGIVSAHRLFSGDLLYIILTITSFLVLIVGCLLYKKWGPIVLLISMFFIGTGFYYLGLSTFMGKPYEGKQEVVARVTDDISENDYYYKLVLEDCFIGGESAKGISLSVRKDDDKIFNTGDIISFYSYVDQVKLFELGSFNSYYLRDKTAYSATIDSSDVFAVSGDVKLDEKIRKAIKDLLYSNMTEENAGTAYAVLTGDKTNLDSQVKEIYRQSGIIHLLTVSGLHISFLAGVLAFIFNKLKINRVVNLIITAGILLFYCYICGFTPSVVRATIMGLVLICAPLFAREYDSLTSLGVAGFIILLISPLSGLDAGFLMSFSSVVAIFLLYKPFEKILAKVLPKYFAGTISVSISAQIGILPYIASFWQDLNFLSFLVNIVVIPFFGFLFILLFASVIISFIPYLGIILKLSDWGFSGIYYVAEFFANTKAKIDLRPFDIITTAMIYVYMFTVSYFVMLSAKIKGAIIACLISMLSVYALTNNIVPVKLSSSVTYLTCYDYESLFLTNKSGEVLYIGNDFYYLQEEWLYFNKISNVDYFVAVDTSWKSGDNFLTASREYKAQEIICCQDNFTNAIEEKVINSNAPHFVGDFLVEYIYKNAEYVGLKIDFDNNSIFFASNQNLSYNSYTYMANEISKESFDVVFLGKREYYASNFQGSNIVVAKYNANEVDASYSKNGNITIDLVNNLIRSID